MKRMIFSIDPALEKKMQQIPDGEKSTVVRMALRKFFEKIEGGMEYDEQNSGRAQAEHKNL